MFDLVPETVSVLQAETASYPEGVQIWMRVMAISFLISLLFVFKKPGARWILLAFVLNVLGLIIGKILFPEASRTEIGTIVHLVFWTPILWVIWRTSIRPAFAWQGKAYLDRIYLVWFCWISLMMATSLLFDFRALLLT